LQKTNFYAKNNFYSTFNKIDFHRLQFLFKQNKNGGYSKFNQTCIRTEENRWTEIDFVKS